MGLLDDHAMLLALVLLARARVDRREENSQPRRPDTKAAGFDRSVVERRANRAGELRPADKQVGEPGIWLVVGEWGAVQP